MTVSPHELPAGTPNRLDMRIGCYILFAICTVCLILRIYMRTFLAGKLGLDDFLIVLAWIAEVAHIAAVKLQFESGTGWHVADLAVLPNGHDILSRMVFWPWITQWLYYFGLGCIKGSIVALYLRLAVTPLQRKVLWGTLAFILLQGAISTIVVAGFLCSPLSLVWTDPQAVSGPKCINILKFNYYNAALGIVMDVFLATAPLVVISKLQMDVKRKRALGIMFSLGALAIGATIARQVTNSIAINNTSDFTWHWAPTALCSILESSLGIIFVSVPAMAPLFKNWIGHASTAGKYTPDASDQPGTFGKLSNKNRPKLRPDDESFLYETRVTAVDPKDRDGYELENGLGHNRLSGNGGLGVKGNGSGVESFEMDVENGTSTYLGDSGSESRIIREEGGERENDGGKVKENEDKVKPGRRTSKSTASGHVVTASNGGEGWGSKDGGVRVDVDYQVKHSKR